MRFSWTSAQCAWLSWWIVKHAASAFWKPMLSTLWFTDSLMSSAVIVGSAAMRRANSRVRSASSSVGKTLLTMPEPVRLVDVERVAGEHELLGLARPELPRVREVLDAAHPEPGADHVGEARVLGRHDEVARPHEHEAGGVDRAVAPGRS